MQNSIILKTAAVFSLISLLIVLAGIVVAVPLKGLGGSGPIMFGEGAILAQLAAAAPRPAMVDTLAFLGPLLALPIGAGWYLLLKERPLARLGVLLWYVGMVFIITQDAMQLAHMPKWIAWLGIVASVVTMVSLACGFLAPGVRLPRSGVGVGIMVMLMVWIPAVGWVMWRRRHAGDSARLDEGTFENTRPTGGAAGSSG